MVNKIIPAILEDSVEEVERKVKLVQDLVKRVQIDVIDGKFADNATVEPGDLIDIDFGSLAVDFHLMTEEPVEYIEECLKLGDKTPSIRAIGHIERMSNQKNFVEETKKNKFEVGFALDLYTPVSSIEEEFFKELDCILLMSVKAGFSGQKFDSKIIEKIMKLRDKGFGNEITMDGGMDLETIPIVRQAGADTFGVTSFLWKGDKVEDRLGKLEEVSK